MGQTQLYSIIWGIISFAVAIYFKSIDWTVLYWIFIIFSVLCWWTLLRTIFPGRL